MTTITESHVALLNRVNAAIETPTPLVEDVFAVCLFFVLDAARQLDMDEVELMTAVTRGRNKYCQFVAKEPQPAQGGH